MSKTAVASAIILLGLIAAAASLFTGIGVTLSHWSGGSPLSQSMWDGFVTYLVMLFSGLILVIIGKVIE